MSTYDNSQRDPRTPAQPFNDALEKKTVRAKELESLRQAMMRTWWKLSLGLWLLIAMPCLWWVRSDLLEIKDFFTWAAVRSIIVFERPAAMGIGFCVAVTFSLLISESRQILWGLSKGERARLLVTLDKIHAQGPSHPQWKIISPRQDLSQGLDKRPALDPNSSPDMRSPDMESGIGADMDPEVFPDTEQ